MKNTRILFLLVITLAMPLASNATTITEFGNGTFTETFSSFSTTSPQATYFEVSGTDLGQQLFGSFTPVAVSGSTPQLQLAALKTAGTASSNFQFVLFDSLGNELTYQGSWLDLPNGISSVATLNFLSSVGSWNGTAISLGLLTSGPGNTLTVQLDNLAAIPEPSTVAILGLALAGGAVMARRRSARQSS